MYEYSLVHEGDNHFEVQDNLSGKRRVIAKDAIPTELHDQIRGLPGLRRMQDGGEIEGPMPQPTPTPAPEPVPEPAAPEEPKLDLESLAPGQAQPATSQAPMPTVTPPVGYPQDDFEKMIRGSYGAQESALKNIANVQSLQAQGAQNLAAQQEQKMNEAYQNYQTAISEEGKRIQDQRDQVLNQKIDPNHFWNQSSGFEGGARRAMAILGMVLGGPMQLRTGVNPAGQIIQKAIEEDLQTQRDNLDTKKGLLRQEYERYGNINTAYSAANLHMTNMFQSQLQQLANQSQSTLVQEQAKQAISQLEMNKGMQLNQLAMNRAVWNLQQKSMGVGPGAKPISDQELALLHQVAPETAKQMIRIPTLATEGNQFANVHVPNDKVRDTMSEALPHINTLNDLLNQSDQLIDKYGSGYIPYGAARDRGQTLQAQMKEELKDLGKTGMRINEFTDDKYLNQIVKNPASLKTEQARSGNLQLRSLLRSKVGGFLSTGATTYNPEGAINLFRTGLAK